MAVVRTAARVLILGPDDRVFLQHCITPEGWDGWITPGGMLEEGESPEDAACRELIEEAGIRDVELGPAIWTRRDTFMFNGITYDQRETFFWVRLDSYVDAAPTFTDEQLALEGIAGHRWWTLDELEGVVTAPRELVSLVRDLLRDGPPPEPLDAGV